MKFRTEISLPEGPFPIGHTHTLLCLGSCFAERIGNRLVDAKFMAQINPLGILYNPLSLTKALKASIENTPQTLLEGRVEHLGKWHSFDLHSDMSHTEEALMVEGVEQAVQFMHKTLKEADYLLLTFGTAWAFRHKKSDAVVANCHKIPPSEFEKSLLPLDQINRALESAITEIQKFNPRLKILLTVSPVRHLKDTLQGNFLSKSLLRVAINHLEQTFENLFYFPSWEIMMDDLRDYRYYTDDLLHPTPFAEQYIWEKFQNTWISEDSRKLIQDWEKVRSGLAHRPFNPGSASHQQFLLTLKQQLLSLDEYLDCSLELREVEQQLKKH